MRKTFFRESDRAEIIERISRLTPSTPRRWGRMTAPQMVAHLRDQMSHCLGLTPCTPVKTILRGRLVRYLSIYVVPWPKGRIKGPPDAFVTQPSEWSADVDALVQLVHRFGTTDTSTVWPNHALFGPMRGVDWGFFCVKHFDHHLRQFGQ